MKKYTQTELDKIIADHNDWLLDENKGKCANLSYADLSYINLREVDLRSANLRGVTLSYANISYANLSSANLRYANLIGTDLCGTNLNDTNLSHTNLSHANLREANLSNADVSFANLSYANVLDANLVNVNLNATTLQMLNGYITAQASWAMHGECGRMLTGIIINNEARYFCGCFSGNGAELLNFIDEGRKQYKDSRLRVFKFISECLEISIANNTTKS